MSLWNDFKNKKRISSSHRRIYIKPTLCQRTSLFTYQRASYTLEAAVVIPIMSAYLVTLLFFFSILGIQCEVDEALLYAGRKTAVESCVADSEEVLFLSAETYLVYALQEKPLVEKWIQNGIWGISLWKSRFDGDEIQLYAEYVVKLPLEFLGIEEVKLTSQNVFRKWIGDRALDVEEGAFYITKYGEVYHVTLECRALHCSVSRGTIEQIEYLRGKNGQKYYECSKCDWVDSKKERIYYTDYGTLYHKDIACSSIKRIVEKVTKEDIGDRRPCSFCCKE